MSAVPTFSALSFDVQHVAGLGNGGDQQVAYPGVVVTAPLRLMLAATSGSPLSSHLSDQVHLPFDGDG